MTPAEKNVVKGLVALAWADGLMADGERGVIEGLLCTYNASDEEERELLEFAQVRRTVEDDVPVDALSSAERELLMLNGILLVFTDGEQSAGESAALKQLVSRLELTEEDYQRLLVQARGAKG